jgi:hypothetical protein
MSLHSSSLAIADIKIGRVAALDRGRCGIQNPSVFGNEIRPGTARILGGCCRALKLHTMPSLSMHTNHGVLRRRDDGVLDMRVPHARGNGGH